jgi:hypothetical protein
MRSVMTRSRFEIDLCEVFACLLALHTRAMFPPPLCDIPTSSTYRPMRTAPRRTHSEFEGEILSFAPPSTPDISDTTRSQAAPIRDSFVTARSSQNIYNLNFQPPVTPSSVLGSPFAFEQQGEAGNGRSQSRSQLRRHGNASNALAYSVLASDSNKLCFIALCLRLTPL